MLDGLRKAKVYVQDKYAGILMETEEGYAYIYDDEYIANKSSVSISLTMPVSKKEYTSNVLFPFFDGLIPEGWLLEIVCHNWKLSMNDRFGLLLATCRDCVGDVYLVSEVE